ncbi:PQQ-binding-like beta-propeller repeat protein [Verrucomicrobiales bacterium]|nr:PQQ-binding-like beta-propeller repeat protein [Verrucomicrobiales bacterium]
MNGSFFHEKLTPNFKKGLSFGMNVLKHVLFCFVIVSSSAVLAEDWPHFLGAQHNFHSNETGLNLVFDEAGPPVKWEVERGRGHSGVVVAGGKLVFIHQVEKEEEIRCLNADSGKDIWKYRYGVDVAQSYGIVDAPRSSPVIDPSTGLVYSLGNDGDLICLKLETGEVVWQKNLDADFGPSPFFFGYGSSPLVHGEKLIVQVGAKGACVVAFNKADGEVIWQSAHEWNGSYASPVVGMVNGEERLFVFAGGMVKPPHGGLLCINPKDGNIDSSFSWRSDNFASVNGATPVPCGPNRVFITEDYGLGGVMLEFDSNFQPRVVWDSPEFGCQFQTPIYHDGYLYGFGGNGGLMLAFDANSGRMLWNEIFYKTTIQWKDRPIPISLGHAHLIYIDGGFLCLTENGALLRMDLGPGGYEIRSKARLFYAPETWAPPVVSDGKLFINQNEMGSRLICYDVSG